MTYSQPANATIQLALTVRWLTGKARGTVAVRKVYVENVQSAADLYEIGSTWTAPAGRYVVLAVA